MNKSEAVSSSYHDMVWKNRGSPISQVSRICFLWHALQNQSFTSNKKKATKKNISANKSMKCEQKKLKRYPRRVDKTDHTKTDRLQSDNKEHNTCKYI